MSLEQQIRDLAQQSTKPLVRSLLLQAAEVDATTPEPPAWRVGRVRVRQRNCPGCQEGVVFRGTEKDPQP